MILSQFENSYNDMLVPTELQKGKKVLVNASKSVQQRRAEVLVQPSGSIPSSLSSLANSILDFRIEQPLDRITHMDVKISYANNSGATCTTCAIASWKKQEQIYSDNGTKLLYQTTDSPQTVLTDFLFRDRNDHELTYVYRGTTVNYDLGVTNFPNGNSGTYILPVADVFIRNWKPRPYEINGNLMVRIQFENVGRLIASGDMSITGIQLICHGYYESEQQKRLSLQRALSNKQVFFYAPQHMIFTSNLSPSSLYSIRLTGLKGYCPMLYFFVRDSADKNSPANAFTFERVESYEIKEQNGKSLTGFNQVTEPQMIINYGYQFPNLFLNHSQVQVHSFCQSPGIVIPSGSNNGNVYLDSFNTLEIRTKPNLVAGSYDIHIVALIHQCLEYRNGSLQLHGTV